MTDQNTHSDTDHDEDRKDDPSGEDQQSDTEQQDESEDDKKPSVFKKPIFWIILVIVVVVNLLIALEGGVFIHSELRHWLVLAALHDVVLGSTGLNVLTGKLGSHSNLLERLLDTLDLLPLE